MRTPTRSASTHRPPRLLHSDMPNGKEANGMQYVLRKDARRWNAAGVTHLTPARYVEYRNALGITLRALSAWPHVAPGTIRRQGDQA